jgi:CO/xanthine dehydrogenase Mo-binding subunit
MIKAEMISRASKIWDISGDEITYSDEGTVVGPDDAEGNKRAFSFNELASKLQATGGLIAVSASSSHTTQGAAYGGHIVDLKVDRDTGKTEILRYTAIQDVGTAIHPDYVEGQIQGGIAQGVGMALNEEYYYDSDGHLMNGSFLDYRVPVANDLPMLDVEMVEVPNPGHPFGVRGVGEVPIVPPQPTIRNAIYDAIGVRFYHTPMSPRRVLDELL